MKSEEQTTNKIPLIAFFLVLLAVPVLIANYSNWFGDDASFDQERALERYGFYLEDVTEDWGIDFVHKEPEFDSKLDHIMPQIASVGASVAVVDFNNDGLQDFYVTNSDYGAPNALYKNNGNGNFENVAKELGIASVNNAETGVSMSSVWGDYDNDGYEDLFLVKWGKPALYHNDKGNGFSKVDMAEDFPDWVTSNTAVGFDYNNDGRLHLFMRATFNERVNPWVLETTRIMQKSFAYAQNG
jgi:hypothetical protein